MNGLTIEMLLFHNYTATKLEFDLNKSFLFKDAVEIIPTFEREIKIINDDLFVIYLSVIIDNQNLLLPFHAEIQIEGLFELKDCKNKLEQGYMVDNATAILFPYLRTTLATIT